MPFLDVEVELPWSELRIGQLVQIKFNDLPPENDGNPYGDKDGVLFGQITFVDESLDIVNCDWWRSNPDGDAGPYSTIWHEGQVRFYAINNPQTVF